MHRIHIFGASGSGTSTLGEQVARRMRLPWLDVDTYFWIKTNPPFTTKRPVDARIVALEEDLDDEAGWVVSGSMCGWGDYLMSRFTMAVFLHLKPAIRLQRLEMRERQRYGSRLDAGGDMYQIHKDFMVWAGDYDTAGLDMRSLAVHQRWMTRLRCPVLQLNSEIPVEDLAAEVLAHLP